MATEYPPPFVDRMVQLLGDEAEVAAFLDSLGGERTRGLRVNRKKTTPNELFEILEIDPEPVPWASDGFLVPADRGPLGSHPAHKAGLFYLQEPSAMAPVTAMGVTAGQQVADLAAAPGGKTVQLVDLVGADGLVVANEINQGRRRTLEANLDRWGATNAIVTGIPVHAFAQQYPGRFDAVLLDAPCSGEALFRRDRKARQQWSPRHVDAMGKLQGELLSSAVQAVADGGTLVYSTCAFGRAENEEQIHRLMARHPHLVLLDLGLGRLPGSQPGLPVDGTPYDRTARYWPHTTTGEGQFVAALHAATTAAPGSVGSHHHRSDGQRRHNLGRRSSPPGGGDLPGTAGGARRATGPAGGRRRSRQPNRGTPAISPAEVIDRWGTFCQEVLTDFPWDHHQLVARAGRVWLRPDGWKNVSNRAVDDTAGGEPEPPVGRPGLPLGRVRPGRFEPDHALASVLTVSGAHHSMRLDAMRLDEAAVLGRFLAGHELECDGPNGWVLVTYRRWGLGWGKRVNGRLKNFLPRHLREELRPN